MHLLMPAQAYGGGRQGTPKEKALATSAEVDQLYRKTGQPLFWFDSTAGHAGKRRALLTLLDAADQYGLLASAYPLSALKKLSLNTPDNHEALINADRLFTSAAIAFCRHLYQGADIHNWVSYDGISPLYAQKDSEYLIDRLSEVEDSLELAIMIGRLEPATAEYRLLKDEMHCYIEKGDALRLRQLSVSINYYRWLSHFHFDSFIVVNVSAATLRYYKRDSAVLAMRAVVGGTDTRTPRFAAYCKEVTQYPYWNMPRSILVNEWLNAFKKNPRLLSLLHMEILDRKGKIINPKSINWSEVSAANFPYRIREATGCYNPMGVLKFTLTSPYAVYLHDTNFSGSFLSNTRYQSHGCIRVENPIALANALLPQPVDTAYLKACHEDELPTVLPLNNPVPIFVVYMPAEPSGDGVVRYYKDVYNLLR